MLLTKMEARDVFEKYASEIRVFNDKDSFLRTTYVLAAADIVGKYDLTKAVVSHIYRCIYDKETYEVIKKWRQEYDMPGDLISIVNPAILAILACSDPNNSLFMDLRNEPNNKSTCSYYSISIHIPSVDLAAELKELVDREFSLGARIVMACLKWDYSVDELNELRAFYKFYYWHIKNLTFLRNLKYVCYKYKISSDFVIDSLDVAMTDRVSVIASHLDISPYSTIYNSLHTMFVGSESAVRECKKSNTFLMAIFQIMSQLEIDKITLEKPYQQEDTKINDDLLQRFIFLDELDVYKDPEYDEHTETESCTVENPNGTENEEEVEEDPTEPSEAVKEFQKRVVEITESSSPVFDDRNASVYYWSYASDYRESMLTIVKEICEDINDTLSEYEAHLCFYDAHLQALIEWMNDTLDHSHPTDVKCFPNASELFYTHYCQIDNTLRQLKESFRHISLDDDNPYAGTVHDKDVLNELLEHVAGLLRMSKEHYRSDDGLPMPDPKYISEEEYHALLSERATVCAYLDGFGQDLWYKLHTYVEIIDQHIDTFVKSVDMFESYVHKIKNYMKQLI